MVQICLFSTFFMPPPPPLFFCNHSVLAAKFISGEKEEVVKNLSEKKFFIAWSVALNVVIFGGKSVGEKNRRSKKFGNVKKCQIFESSIKYEVFDEKLSAFLHVRIEKF